MQSIALVTPRGNSLQFSKNFTTEAAKRFALNLPMPLVTSMTACMACQRTELRDIWNKKCNESQASAVPVTACTTNPYIYIYLFIYSTQASVFPSTSFKGTRPFILNNFPLTSIRKLKPFCFKKGNSAKASAKLATVCGSSGGIGMAASAQVPGLV